MDPGRLIVGLHGQWPSATEEAWLAGHRPAGVILFARNVTGPEQLTALCRRLHELVPGLEICADHEGGAVSQLAPALGRPPAAWSLGVLDDVELTAAVHRQTGLAMRAAGIDRVLGPVADVLSEPENPVIGARAFGAGPDLVARHVAAAVAGYLAAGIKVCLKHWPGHGAAVRDTHETEAGGGYAVPDPAPYRAAVAAGADALMVGHLPVGDGRTVATLDGGFLAETRRLLEPTGRPLLLFADDLTMGALRRPMGSLGIASPDGQEHGLVDPAVLPPGWIEAAAAAGCDRLLLRGLPWRALAGPRDIPEGGSPVPVSGGAPGQIPPAGAAADEARSRIWSAVAGDFAGDLMDLLWLDPSAEDRWWGAAGRAEEQREAFRIRLQGGFARVRTASEPAPGGGHKRLLVTSFRPWEPDREIREILTGALAPEGRALVMGHPSLAAAIAPVLPAGWCVGALYDICSEDLAWGPGSAQ